MIVFETCDHCGGQVAGKRHHMTYERDDGDENILCVPCMRNQLEADYKKWEREEDNEH